MKTKTIRIIGEANTKNLIERLKQSKEHFLLIESPYSLKVKLPEQKLNYICAPDNMAMKYWGLLSSIKSQIMKSDKVQKLPAISVRSIQYFHYHKRMEIPKGFKKGDTIKFSNVCEMDISAAYITAAKNLGIISNENFQKLKAGPKQNRLKILGALASQKTVEYWHGNTLIEDLPLQVNPITRNAWFNIVSYTDEIIKEIYLDIEKAALFYYVDNLYFYHSPELEMKVRNHFLKFNFETKVLPLDNFFIFGTSQGPVCVVKRTNEIQPKTFFLPKPKTITYEIRK